MGNYWLWLEEWGVGRHLSWLQSWGKLISEVDYSIEKEK